MNDVPKKSTRGAVQSKTGFGDIWRSFWASHRTSFFASLARLLETPIQTMMTTLVVAIALALPATLLVALTNIQSLGEAWDSSPKLSVYLKMRAKQQAIDSLIEGLQKDETIEKVTYVSASDALDEFQTFSGLGDILASLDENPLPPSIMVTPAAAMASPEQLLILRQRLAKEPLVDEVSLDMEWVRRLSEFMILGKKIVFALAALLGLGVLLVLGNTIRLAIENRRDEIVVAKLVGATNAFVRRPFLYSGAWYGLLGGCFACVIVGVGYWIIQGSVMRLAGLYQSSYVLLGLGFKGGLLLLGASVFLGWLGAWLAVSRHLSEIEPK